MLLAVAGIGQCRQMQDDIRLHGFRKTANGGFIGSSQRSAREGNKLCTALPLVQYPGTHKAGGAGNQDLHAQCTKNSSSTSTTAQQETDT